MQIGDDHLLTSVKSIGCGFEHSCIIHGSGRLVCWGSNEYNQVKYKQARGMYRPFFMVIISGSMNNCAVVGSGVVRCWGYDTHLKEVQTQKVE